MRIHMWTAICALWVALLLSTGCTQSESGNSAAQSGGSVSPGQSPQGSPATETETDRTGTTQNPEIEGADQPDEQTKDDYIRDLNNRLADLDRRIQDLQQRAEQAGKDWNETRDELQEQRRQLEEQMQRLQAASGRAWVDLRDGANAAFDDLQRAFEKASRQFEDDGDDSSATPTGGESQSPGND